jgi:hypothetical protein
MKISKEFDGAASGATLTASSLQNDIYVPLGKTDPNSTKTLVYVGRDVTFFQNARSGIVEMDDKELAALRRSPHASVVEPREMGNIALYKDRLAAQAFELFGKVHDRAYKISGDNGYDLKEEYDALFFRVLGGGDKPKPRAEHLEGIYLGLVHQSPTLTSEIATKEHMNAEWGSRYDDKKKQSYIDDLNRVSSAASSMIARIDGVDQLPTFQADLREDLKRKQADGEIPKALYDQVIRDLDGSSTAAPAARPASSVPRP